MTGGSDPSHQSRRSEQNVFQFRSQDSGQNNIKKKHVLQKLNENRFRIPGIAPMTNKKQKRNRPQKN